MGSALARAPLIVGCTRRVSALAEQSNELRRFLDEAAQSYAPSSAPPSSVLHVPCPSETTLLLDDAFLSLPSLVQADILYKFVCKSTRTVPSYQFMRKLASFAQLRGKRRVIDFSSAFAVVCVGSAVRVRDNSRFERVQGELARVDLDGVAVTYPIEVQRLLWHCARYSQLTLSAMMHAFVCMSM